MKKLRLLTISLLTVAFLATGCSNAEEEKPNISDVTFHEDENEDDPSPRYVDLPTVGSEAVAPLEISANPEYYDNIDLHNFAGQWNGYGVHYPSILKYGDTYYMYSSTPDVNVGIKAYSSKDLINWNFVGVMGYVSKDKGTFAAKAPQVFHLNDSFLMYFKSASGYRVYKSDSPEGTFNPYKTIAFDSNYVGSFFIAPNGKMFYVSGGDSCASIYEMKNFFEIDENSKQDIVSTRIDSYFGNSYKVNNPSIIYVNGVAYLTYSSEEESVKSYRSYFVSAVSPDFSTSESLANSFFNHKQGPVLINTNPLNGSVGLGDLRIIEGPDNASYYAYYTSLEAPGVRRLNVSPIYLDEASLSLSHRDYHTIKPNPYACNLSSINNGTVLSSISSEKKYAASFAFENLSEVYFSYHSSTTTFGIEFSNDKATFFLKENGLRTDIVSRNTSLKEHDVKVVAHDKLDIYLDSYLLIENYSTNFDLAGKIGYRTAEGSKFVSGTFTNIDAYKYGQHSFKQADQTFSAAMCLEEYSKISATNKFVMVDSFSSDFYGYRYLDLSTNRDYARYLVDINEDARYGIELVLNTSFTKYESALGIRLGENDELMFTTTPLGTGGYARLLTAEFDVTKGAKELLIENLSAANLRIISVRLVKTSNYYPEYQNDLSTYATKGIYYETDFRINSNFKAHATYEGARSFAYVGDNTITDFKLTIQVAFRGGYYTSGFVGVGFRCDNFASSSVDDDESLVGYYLEISQYQTKLMKHQYGYGITLGVIDYANTVDEFRTFKISMKGNHIVVDTEDFTFVDMYDQFAFTSGHLAFGSNNVNGLIRNLKVTKA